MTGHWTYTAVFETEKQANEFHLNVWRFTAMDTIRRRTGSTWTVTVRGVSRAQHCYAKTVANRIAKGLIGDPEATAAGFPV
jgi:hypothetical protein